MPVESITAEGCSSRCPLDKLRLNSTAVVTQVQSPCSVTCPLGVSQREYHKLIQQHRLDEAARLIAQTHPMPSITGRICPHPCETPCTRGKVDSTININGLEQYLGDRLLELGPQETDLTGSDQVAVIGSGPSGLAAAYHLTQQGYEVTVFEREKKVGGLLRTSIPSFRLPAAVLDKQIEAYQQMGIQFITGITITDVQELEEQGFKAVIAATGASKPLTLSVMGADARGITSAIELLYDVKAGKAPDLSGRNVVVVGGGSVALDASRTAVRLGAQAVNVICLERIEPGHKDTMLALSDEIEDAINEGVVINTSRSVSSFQTANGYVSGVKVVECLSVREEDGRFNPQFDEAVLPDAIAADLVILAIGQTINPALVPVGFKTNGRGQIVADEDTKQVKANRFAVGDAVTGPTTVVRAAAAGKRAAQTVARFLKGEAMIQKLKNDAMPFFDVDLIKATSGNLPKVPRVERQYRPVTECKISFAETINTFSHDEAVKEAKRCLICGCQDETSFQSEPEAKE